MLIHYIILGMLWRRDHGLLKKVILMEGQKNQVVGVVAAYSIVRHSVVSFCDGGEFATTCLRFKQLPIGQRPAEYAASM